jgi:hypothetical protein
MCYNRYHTYIVGVYDISNTHVSQANLLDVIIYQHNTSIVVVADVNI